MFDNVSNGITVQDSSGRLVYANAAVAAALGDKQLHELCSSDSHVSLSDASHENGHSVPEELRPGYRALRGEVKPSAILDVLNEDTGLQRAFKLQAHPIGNPGDRSLLAVTTWQDISELESGVDRDQSLAAIVRTSDDAIVSKLLDGTVTSWNPAAERLFGWPAAEMIGHSIKRIVPPEKRSDLANILRRLGRGERIEHHETVRIARDGRRIDVSISVSPVVNDDGQIVGAAKICRDVTDRKRIESGQRLLAAAGEVFATSLDIDATLQAVTEIAVGPLADVAAAYAIRDDGALRQIAIAGDGQIPRTWLLAQPEDSANASLVRKSLRSRKAAIFSSSDPEFYTNDFEPMELTENDPNGPSTAMVVPLLARGQVLGALAFYGAAPRREYNRADLELACELGQRAAITVDNARLYAEARSAETRYRTLFGGGAVGVVVVGANGHFLEANDAALKLLGRSLTELREFRFGDGAVSSSDESTIWGVLRKTGAWHGELDLRRSDNELIPIEVHAEEVELPGGAVYLVQWLNVSARKAAERFEDAFLADLAHDLNNPLASIRIQAQLLQRRLIRGVLDERVANDGLAAIEVSTGRMARRINELSDIARLRLGGSLELRCEEFDLITLIQDLIMVHQQTTERHVVTLQSPASQLLVNWDRWRLERVFDNIIANAIKYSPAGGEVSIQLALDETAHGAHVDLSITDEGVGIPASDLAIVFDRFRRGSNVTGRFAGAGIGLCEARQIIEQHGGTIKLVSQEGVATTVNIRLPLSLASRKVSYNLETVV